MLLKSSVSGGALRGCEASCTVAWETRIVGVPTTLNTEFVFIVTDDPAGEVSVIVTTSGLAPEIAPVSGNVTFVVWPAGKAVAVPRSDVVPSVADPLVTVRVSDPVFVVALPACGRIGSKL